MNPPERLLRLVRYQGAWVRMTWPSLRTTNYGWLYDSIEVMARAFFTQRRRSVDANSVAVLFIELHRNAVEHGNKGRPWREVETAFWFGSGGVLFGIRDEGDFFTQKRIKDRLQRRLATPSREKERGGMGALRSQHWVDKVYVSRQENALYLVFLAKKPNVPQPSDILI